MEMGGEGRERSGGVVIYWGRGGELRRGEGKVR